MSRLFAYATVLLLSLVAFAMQSFAAPPVNVSVDGKAYAFSAAQPYVSISGNTMLPYKDLANVLGVRSAYNEYAKTLTFVGKDTIVTAVIGSKVYKLNNKDMNMAAAPAAEGENIYAPVRFIGDAFGVDVSWDGKTRTVHIKTNRPPAAASSKNIILSTTTSTVDSGLLDYLLPYFKKETGYEVKVISVGTGKAIQMGKDGEADVMLVHAKPDEIKFMEDNHGIERSDVMYNDFVLVGSPKDPAAIKSKAAKDIVSAVKAIDTAGAKFISRGDDSGTDKLEKTFWKTAGITPNSKYYISAGAGMGAVLIMANEKDAYTLTDRATYLAMKDKLDLVILCEGDTGLFNQYGVITVNPSKTSLINSIGAMDFYDWIISPAAQELIGKFGVAKYGKALFVPNAG